jgi:hypothetical protein
MWHFLRISLDRTIIAVDGFRDRSLSIVGDGTKKKMVGSRKNAG